jgi:hypothetical protein
VECFGDVAVLESDPWAKLPRAVDRKDPLALSDEQPHEIDADGRSLRLSLCINWLFSNE